uniref:Uncharacterized protein n=1 Tax=Arundo donax TaxID=35708 RepID=A0A0A9AEE3_ARUDO
MGSHLVLVRGSIIHKYYLRSDHH